MNYPVEPTKFNLSEYDPQIESIDKFYCKSGFREYPDHHCKTAYYMSKPFVKSFRNAIDIGCRDGEYTRYLLRDFNHVYAYDPRLRKFFPKNVDVSKVTHFHTALGNSNETAERLGNNKEIKGKFQAWTYLDEYKLTDIDYIKIDTDGYERAIIEGASNTITTYWPVINLEVYFETDTIKWFQKKFGYKVVATCPRGWDHILIKE